MERREFLGVLGGAAAAWPLAAHAQQSGVPVVGFLRSTSLAPFENLVPAFRLGLKEAGFVEGQNVAIEYRYADNQADRLRAMAAELISRPVAVIVANTPSALAAKSATTTIPIVFATGSDPVRQGLVTNLNRPGGNTTGVVFFGGVVGAKRLELLRQLAPKATTIATLTHPASPEANADQREVRVGAQSLGQQIINFEVSSARDIEVAFATIVQRGAGALQVGAGAFLTSNWELIVALAARHALPTSYDGRAAVEGGGLMSYGASITDAYRQAGIYAGRLLKGEKPADLPVVQATKFEFVLNHKTAKALRLEVSDRVLALADEVIE